MRHNGTIVYSIQAGFIVFKLIVVSIFMNGLFQSGSNYNKNSKLNTRRLWSNISSLKAICLLTDRFESLLLDKGSSGDPSNEATNLLEELTDGRAKSNWFDLSWFRRKKYTFLKIFV